MDDNGIIKVVTSIMSSSAAVAGAFVAVYGAIRLIPRELAKWKEQKKAEQRATTAAKALNSALRFIDALLFIGNPLFRSPAEAKNRGENQKDEDLEEVSREKEFYALFYERLKLAEADMKAFSDARDLDNFYGGRSGATGHGARKRNRGGAAPATPPRLTFPAHSPECPAPFALLWLSCCAVLLKKPAGFTPSPSRPTRPAAPTCPTHPPCPTTPTRPTSPSPSRRKVIALGMPRGFPPRPV